MILDSIFANRKRQVEAQKQTRPMEQIEREAESFAQKNSTVDFAKALRGDRLGIIAEVKKASPSKGLICEDFNPSHIARMYEDAGASAVSVLTEESYFKGGAACLEAVRKEVGLPVLRKDFIFDEWQICEARLIGADAILLIAAMLDAGTLKRLYNYAADLGLQALVEAHNEREVSAAADAGAKIIGVNNRNLDDFSIDLDCACRLAPLIPASTVFVAESGIHTKEDAVRMRAAGADAILVGEALMRAPSVAGKLRELKVD